MATSTNTALTPTQYEEYSTKLAEADKSVITDALKLLEDFQPVLEQLRTDIDAVRNRYPFISGRSSSARSSIEQSLQSVNSYQQSLMSIRTNLQQWLSQLQPVVVPTSVPPTP